MSDAMYSFINPMKIHRLWTKHSLLIAILVVAAVLRLHHVTQPFTDYASWRETSTAMMADNFYRRNWNIFYPEVSWNGPGPSYQGREFQTITYISALLYIPFGQQDWIGRGVAAAFGVWGIFALYQLIRRVWGQDYAFAGAAACELVEETSEFVIYRMLTPEQLATTVPTPATRQPSPGSP